MPLLVRRRADVSLARFVAIAVGVVVLGALAWALRPGAPHRPRKPTLLVFVSTKAPLAASFEETLAAAPVRQLLQRHFTLSRLDAARSQELFHRYVGSAGALGSVVLDDSSPSGVDVVAVLPGYADVARFSAFLDGVAQHIVKLRALRDKAQQTGAEQVALGELYAEQGSLARARYWFESPKAPDPALSAALERLARLDVQAGKTENAARELEQAKTATPPARADRLLVTEALLLSSQRRVGSAIALLIKSLPALPQDSETAGERARGWLLLGSLEHEIGQDERALAALEKVRSETPDRELQRIAAEQILHIQHPEPGHVH